MVSQTKATHPTAQQGTTSKPEALWNRSATAKYLGISVSTLERLIQRGRGPRALRIGAQIRFLPADVQAYLESCATVGGGAAA